VFDPKSLTKAQRSALESAIGFYLKSKSHAPFDSELNLLNYANSGRIKMARGEALTENEASALARAVQFSVARTRSATKRVAYYDVLTVIVKV